MTSQQAAPRSVPKYFLYGESQREVDPRFLHVESVAARSCLHNWTIRPHAHRDLHHFLLLERGEGQLRVETQIRHLRASSLVSVPATLVHSFRFVAGSDGWVVTASSALLQRLTADDPELLPVLEVGCSFIDKDASGRREIPQMFRALVTEYRNSSICRAAAIEAWLINILVAVRRSIHLPDKGLASQDAGSRLVARYRLLVEERFKTTASIADYAAQLCVSEEKLRKACARITGASPLRLLANRRLVEAKRGLLYTGMNVAQIAYDCGFEDPAYFTRFFTRSTGKTPSTFRLQHQR